MRAPTRSRSGRSNAGRSGLERGESRSQARNRRPAAATAALAAARTSADEQAHGGPSTQAELCKQFDALDSQVLQGNGIIGNPLFHASKKLGDTAKRYPSNAGVTSDGQALTKLSGGSSLSGTDLENATQHIADLCGHPLGIGSSDSLPRQTPAPSPTQADSQTVGLAPGETDLVRSRAQLIFSYDYRSLPAYRRAVEQATDGPARPEILKTLDDLVKNVAPRYKSVVVGQASEVGVISRDATTRTFMVFLDQTSSSTLSASPKVTQSGLTLDLNADDKVTRISADAQTATGTLPIQDEVRAAITPMLTLSADGIENGVAAVLAHATGRFQQQFETSLPTLRPVIMQNKTHKNLNGPVVVALGEQDSVVVRALVYCKLTITSATFPGGVSETDRWIVELVREGGTLKIRTLEPAA
jgi:hypothetical protein